MMRSCALLLLAACFSISVQAFAPEQKNWITQFGPEEKQRYDDYVLIQIEQADDALCQRLQSYENIDIWGAQLAADGTRQLSVFLPDTLLKNTLLKKENVTYSLTSKGIQNLLDQEVDYGLINYTSDDDEDWFKAYHPLTDIRAWYERLAERFPHLMTFVPTVGQSHERRDLFAVHLTSNSTLLGGKKKKQVWFQGQIHAREWISGATVQYLTYQFVKLFGHDSEITNILDTTELIIIPIVNPDGFEYTWSKDRLWRKNRRSNGRSFGFGVDLNRNYNVHWDDETGASRSPLSQTYKGPFAVSEPETQALTSYFLKHPQLVGAIDFHSFSQLILRPLGYTRTPAAHEAEHRELGDAMRRIIFDTHQRDYSSVPAISLYPTTGTASDWFYGNEVFTKFGHRVYGYTIELRPKNAFGGQGFILPPSEIIPTGEEIFAAMRYFVKHVTSHPL